MLVNICHIIFSKSHFELKKIYIFLNNYYSFFFNIYSRDSTDTFIKCCPHTDPTHSNNYFKVKVQQLKLLSEFINSKKKKI